MATKTPKPLTKADATRLLWHRGNLTWKLHKAQKEMYDVYKDSRSKTVVFACSRRLGKTYLMCVMAIEECLRLPNAVVKFVAPNTKHIKMVIRPIMKTILADAPKELKPSFNTPDSLYKFPNGSEIQLAGTDGGHAESIRGANSTLCLVDEAGFCDDLKYVVGSILLPSTLTTNGKVVLSSTPPKSPDHDLLKFIEEAIYRGSFAKKTIYENPMLTPEQIEDMANELGGKNSVEFRRECLCELIKSEERAIVPEFDAPAKADIVKEWVRPPHYDGYVAGDIGFKDLTGFLFGYYDFRAAKLVIEDEIVMNGPKMTTAKLADAIKAKEREIFFDPVTREVKEPYLRVCDNNLIVINDLGKLHNLYFIPTAKDDKAAAINNLRLMVDGRQLVIHPRCKTLIQHLENGVWTKNKKSFDHCPDGSHYDLLDSLIYLVRNLNKGHNPYPKGYGVPSSDNYFDPNVNKAYEETPTAKAVKNMFTVRRSLGSFGGRKP